MKNDIKEIEIIGIDGNCCVRTTAIDGVKNGLKVIIDLTCVEVMNHTRFEKTLEKLKDNKVIIK